MDLILSKNIHNVDDSKNHYQISKMQNDSEIVNSNSFEIAINKTKNFTQKEYEKKEKIYTNRITQLKSSVNDNESFNVDIKEILKHQIKIH